MVEEEESKNDVEVEIEIDSWALMLDDLWQEVQIPDRPTVKFLRQLFIQLIEIMSEQSTKIMELNSKFITLEKLMLRLTNVEKLMGSMSNPEEETDQPDNLYC